LRSIGIAWSVSVRRDAIGNGLRIADAVGQTDAAKSAGADEESGHRRESPIDRGHAIEMADLELWHRQRQPIDAREYWSRRDAEQVAQFRVRFVDERAIGGAERFCRVIQ
jgi:hypothetical protein